MKRGTLTNVFQPEGKLTAVAARERNGVGHQFLQRSHKADTLCTFALDDVNDLRNLDWAEDVDVSVLHGTVQWWFKVSRFSFFVKAQLIFTVALIPFVCLVIAIAVLMWCVCAALFPLPTNRHQIFLVSAFSPLFTPF